MKMGMNKNIRRREFLRTMSVVGGSFGLPAWLCANPETSKRPNVIVLISDDHSADCLGVLGHPQVKTPNLDKLAKQGMIFHNAYVFGSNQPSVCAPARTQIHSGKNLYHWRQKQPASGDPDNYCFGRAMRKAGYITFRSGKGVNVPSPLCAEFHRNIEKSGMKIETHVDNGIAFIREHAGKQLFFFYMAPRIPHSPYPTREKFRRMYRPEDIELPPTYMPRHPFFGPDGIDDSKEGWPGEKTRQTLAKYYASISHMDDQFGRLFATLKETGQYNNTIILFAGDNGYSIGDHGLGAKQDLYEFGGMHVPFLIAGPGIPQGRTKAFAYLMDIFPTICELTGTQIPSSLDGKSLVPVIRGEKSRVRDYLFTAYKDSQRALRDTRWKIIHYPQIRKTQLFDLRDDPYEMNDLGEYPQHAERVDQKLRFLRKVQKEVGDTLPLKAGRSLE